MDMQNLESLCTTSPFPAHIRRVGIFSPAGIPAADALQRGLRRLLDWGLQVVCPKEGPPVRFFSASDEARAARFNELLKNGDIDAVIATRGGYGCARMLKDVHWDLLRKRGIPVIGYSDLTAFHAAAFKYGCPNNICGPMIGSTLGRQVESDADEKGFAFAMRSLAAALTDGSRTCVARPLESLREGFCQGPLIPANLAVLTSLVGTDFMPDLTGVILVLEDVNEPAYRVDRCLQQIDASHGLKNLGGMVFGQFSGGEDAHWIPGVFADFARRCGGPVCCGLPFGHGLRSMSLPVGGCAQLTAGRDGSSLCFG